MKFKNKADSDNFLRIIGSIAKVEVKRALEPLNQRIAALEAANAALRAERKAEETATAASIAARYESLG